MNKHVQNYTYEHVFLNPKPKVCSKTHLCTHLHKKIKEYQLLNI